MAFAPGLLAGRRALVTGGGTGLGRSIGRRFLELGASLAICGRRAAVLEATAEALRAEIPGAVVTTHTCDIRDPAAVESMLDHVWRDGAAGILVNNAAANFLAQTHRLSARALDAVLGTTLHGAAYCTIGCGRRWIEAGQPGVVLSILTLSALQGGAFTAPSAMAKAGLLAMTQSLAVEWGPRGIRLVAIAPGTFPTEAAVARLRPGGVEHAGVPLRRAGRHQELTDLAAFLVSDHAGYITGECVVADGGRRLLGGARAGAQEMLDWTDADWAAQRARTPAR
jgi:NAD(P)-dependent dehydrogenase (short-subunit alcohol dehydrogenase family)